MSDDIVQEAIKSLEEWDTCYSQNEKMRDVALAALKSQSARIEALRAENEKLRREAAIRIDQIEREQEAHLKTMADFNKQAEMNARLLTESSSLRAELENEKKRVARLFAQIGQLQNALDIAINASAAAAAIREEDK